jgi:hypothetical protein
MHHSIRYTLMDVNMLPRPVRILPRARIEQQTTAPLRGRLSKKNLNSPSKDMTRIVMAWKDRYDDAHKRNAAALECTCFPPRRPLIVDE